MILMQNVDKNIWMTIGFLGQGCFFLRFLIQWIVSEREKRSTIPVIFWYLSLAGAFSILVYAIYRKDPVFILGQGLGFLVYARNIWFIHSKKSVHEKMN